MQRVIDAFEQNLGGLITTSVARVLAAKHPFYSLLPAAVLQQAVGGAFQAVLSDLKAGTTTQFARFLVAASQKRVEQGATPSDVISGFNIGIETANDFFSEHFADDAPAQVAWFKAIYAMSLN